MLEIRLGWIKPFCLFGQKGHVAVVEVDSRKYKGQYVRKITREVITLKQDLGSLDEGREWLKANYPTYSVWRPASPQGGETEPSWISSELFSPMN